MAKAAPFNTLGDNERHATVFDALWPHGPLEKDAAVRAVAQKLRDAGQVACQRLRADGPVYADVLSALESAVKADVLDRPSRGHLRAIKNVQTMPPEDWRHALVVSLGEEPTARDQAVRAAAEWARDNLGVASSARTLMSGTSVSVPGMRWVAP